MVRMMIATALTLILVAFQPSAPPERDWNAAKGFADLDTLTQNIVDRLLTEAPLTEGASPVVMIYGILNQTQEDLDLDELVARLKTELAVHPAVQLHHDAYRAHLDREAGTQAIERVSEEKMLQYARFSEANYLLSGRVTPGERGLWSRLRAGRTPFQLRLSLQETVGGQEIWSAQWELRFDRLEQGETVMRARFEP